LFDQHNADKNEAKTEADVFYLAFTGEIEGSLTGIQEI
jgi:hypothetical protein